jgi:hypothetical protein
LDRDFVLPKPVEIIRGEINPCGDTPLAECIKDLSGNIPAEGSVGNVEIRGVRVPETEPSMMLGGEDDVTDPCELCEVGPVIGMKLMRIECLREILEIPPAEILRGSYQGMTDDGTKLAIDVPVNEKAESLILKPFQPVFSVQ